MDGLIALLIWALILGGPAVVMRLRRKGASSSTVSGNDKPVSKYAAERWDQDEPWPECFEEDDL